MAGFEVITEVILRHMRCGIQIPALGDEVFGVISLIAGWLNFKIMNKVVDVLQFRFA